MWDVTHPGYRPALKSLADAEHEKVSVKRLRDESNTVVIAGPVIESAMRSSRYERKQEALLKLQGPSREAPTPARNRAACRALPPLKRKWPRGRHSNRSKSGNSGECGALPGFNNAPLFGYDEMTMTTVHAFEFLDSPASHIAGKLIVLFGNDRFLQVLARQSLIGVIAAEDAAFDVNIFDGDSVQWRDVSDSLHTVSLFSQENRRVTVIDNGDHFAATNRSHLEEFLDQPGGDGVLVLIVSTWAASTRLYKKLDKEGCQIHCGELQTRAGSNKSRDSAGICKWIVKRASQVHQLALTQTLARQLMEIVEWNTGRADQEMSKLSLFGKQVDEATLRAVCGGWKVQSVWEAAMAAAQGNTQEALQHLANLIQSGEHPLALYGQLSWSLRRFGRLWEISTRQMRQGARVDLSANLARAGFRNWSGEMSAAEASATQLSRARVRRFYEWLLETDLAIKGSHSEPDRARFALERLFFRMARLSSRATR